MLFLLDRIEDREHARFRALAQILIDKEAGVEAFEEYMRLAFPFLQSKLRQESAGMKKALENWVAQGPLGVMPLHMAKGRSRMKQRLIRVENEKIDRILKKRRFM